MLTLMRAVDLHAEISCSKVMARHIYLQPSCLWIELILEIEDCITPESVEEVTLASSGKL